MYGVAGGTERYIRKVCEGRLLDIIQVVGVAEIRIGWVKKAHSGKDNRGYERIKISKERITRAMKGYEGNKR